MTVRAALLPGLVVSAEASVVVVVDVLRATTTLVSLLDAGCTDIVVAETIEEATAIGRKEGRLLVGEEGGLPPRHFDFGNSPRQFAGADMAGARVAFATTNGARALQLARRGPLVLAGCVRNATEIGRAHV